MCSLPQLLQFSCLCPMLAFFTHESCLLLQVAKHLVSHKQINTSQGWRIGLRSGKKDRRRTNLKTCQGNLLISQFTPFHRDFLHYNFFLLLCYHHLPVVILNYQELIGAKRGGLHRGGYTLHWFFLHYNCPNS